MPFQKPTSVMFGGADLGTLYVTSMRFGLTDAALAEQPLAGSLLHLDVGVEGTARTCLRRMKDHEQIGSCESSAETQGWSVYTDPGFISHAGRSSTGWIEKVPRSVSPTSEKHENRNGVLQGGAFMTFMDRALGATARHITETPATATVTMTVQFVDAVGIGEMVVSHTRHEPSDQATRSS